MNPAAQRILVHVNGEPRELAPPASVGDLLFAMGLSGRRGIAAAVNGSVVPRTQWASCPLSGGEQVLVIRATQGG